MFCSGVLQPFDPVIQPGALSSYVAPGFHADRLWFCSGQRSSLSTWWSTFPLKYRGNLVDFSNTIYLFNFYCCIFLCFRETTIASVSREDFYFTTYFVDRIGFPATLFHGGNIPIKASTLGRICYLTDCISLFCKTVFKQTV